MFPILFDYRIKEEIAAVQKGGGVYLVVAVPWAMLAEHEERALRTHGQSLKRLAERGGLGVDEALAILADKSYFDMPRLSHPEAHRRLGEAVRSWLQTPRSGVGEIAKA